MIPVLPEFAGPWTLARRIDDRKGGQTGHLHGTAVFRPDGPHLLYEETGTLILGAAPPLHATRRYLWRAGPDGGIEVLFDDGRPFHAIGRKGEAAHWCDPDTYRVAYDFALWPDWQATWTVSGPAKDYTMVSVYTRA